MDTVFAGPEALPFQVVVRFDGSASAFLFGESTQRLAQVGILVRLLLILEAGAVDFQQTAGMAEGKAFLP
jgi:hypothetical protein